MAGKHETCVECETATKCKCIRCKISVCNRPSCSVEEKNEEVEGWLEMVCVAYCNNCFFNVQSIEAEGDKDDEVAHFLAEDGEVTKKSSGRRSLWSQEHVDDMVDIIVNNENYKRKLIFTNNRRSTNTEVYQQVLAQVKARHPEFPFKLEQIRNKFKWCVGTCKKVALTIQTATGINRFVDEKGFGKWFNALFPLIKSRDSCQPEQSIEPSTYTSSSTCSTPVNEDESDEEEEDIEEKTKEPALRKGRDMFVPIKKRKKKNKEEPLAKVLKILENMVANDPTKDLLNFMREDAERSRQCELEVIKLLSNQAPPAQGHAPQPQPCYPPAQHWVHSMVPQTPPSDHHVINYPMPGASSPFDSQMNKYTKL